MLITDTLPKLLDLLLLALVFALQVDHVQRQLLDLFQQFGIGAVQVVALLDHFLRRWNPRQMLMLTNVLLDLP